MLECIVISPEYGEWNMDLVSSSGSVLIFLYSLWCSSKHFRHGA